MAASGTVSYGRDSTLVGGLPVCRSGSECRAPYSQSSALVGDEKIGHRATEGDNRYADRFLNTQNETIPSFLAVVDELVRAHGGRVTADSMPGGGASFTVLLPQAASKPHTVFTDPSQQLPTVDLKQAVHVDRGEHS